MSRCRPPPHREKYKPWVQEACDFFKLFINSLNCLSTHKVKWLSAHRGWKSESKVILCWTSPVSCRCLEDVGLLASFPGLAKAASGWGSGIWNIPLCRDYKCHEIESCGEEEEGGIASWSHGPRCCSTSTTAEFGVECLFIPWGLSLIGWNIAGLILAQPCLSAPILTGIMGLEKARRINQASVYSRGVFFFFTMLYYSPAPLVARAPTASEKQCFQQKRPVAGLLWWLPQEALNAGFECLPG